MKKNKRWSWLCNPLGIIQEFELEEGVIYRLSATLGPKSKLRVHNGEGKPMFMFESVMDFEQGISHRFTFDKGWRGHAVVMAWGYATDVDFQMVGINMESFK